HMRGIADQCQPIADEGARHEIAERKRARLVQGSDLAETQAEALLELAVKLFVVEGHDTGGLGTLLGPDQRGAIAGQRQDRERTRGQKVLLRTAMMFALVA